MPEHPEKKGAKKGGAKKASSAKKTAPSKKAGPGKKGAGAKKLGAKKAPTSSKRAAGRASHAEIAEHAYYIHQREGGDATENWLRAERELSDE